MPDRSKILIALGVLALVCLSYGGRERSGIAVLAGAALLAVTTVRFQVMMRQRSGLERARKRIAGVLMAGGVLLVAVWLVLKPGGGLALSGICLFYLGLGQLVAAWRTSRTRRFGLLICAGSAAAFGAGLALAVHVHAWWLGVAALALLIGPIGLTLVSEQVMGRWRKPSWYLLAGLAVAAGGVLVLERATGPPPGLAWALAGALLVLVGSMASSTQADVLIVVTVVGLAWSAIPDGVGRTNVLKRQDGATLAALGDSYMSGEGAQDYFEKTNEADANECRRAPTAYAHEVVAGGRAPEIVRLVFLACSGAKAKHLYSRAQYPNEPVDDGTPDVGEPQLTQLRALAADVSVVIVSIGGNDAGFSRIGRTCLAPASCVERGQAWLDDLVEVEQRVAHAYTEIRSAVRDRVPVVAVPYPQPIAEKSCRSSLLAGDEHRFLHGFVKQLNGRIRQAARDAKIYFLDEMRGALDDGMRICDGRKEDRGVNFIALKSVFGIVEEALHPGNWIHNSLHPNERGHDAMGEKLADWLGRHDGMPVRPQGEDIPEPFEPATFEEVMNGSVARCGRPPEPEHCDRDDDDWTITQVADLLARATPAALLVALGCWIAWLPVLARSRRFWAERADGRRPAEDPGGVRR